MASAHSAKAAVRAPVQVWRREGGRRSGLGLGGSAAARGAEVAGAPRSPASGEMYLTRLAWRRATGAARSPSRARRRSAPRRRAPPPRRLAGIATAQPLRAAGAHRGPSRGRLLGVVAGAPPPRRPALGNLTPWPAALPGPPSDPRCPLPSPLQTRRVAAAAAPDTRRAVLSGLFAGAAALVAAPAARAIDLFDDRKVRDNGFDIIYEARDLDLPQSTRDGIDQFRGSLDATKKRIKESESRIDTKLPAFVEKKYWTLAREELRGQLGTLRFDINTVAETLGKDGKKKALAAKVDFLKAADGLDFAIRTKNPEKAATALAATRATLDAALAALG